MTQSDKELLLRDLCARLPYGVKILHETWNYEWDQEMTLLVRVVGIDEKFIYVKVIDTHNGEEYRDDRICVDTFDDKLFLRPMSSMTEEESIEYANCGNIIANSVEGGYLIPNPESTSWLDKKMFDWRGLIPKNLALKALEGMYK